MYLLRLEKAVDNIKFFQEMFNGRSKTLGEQFQDAARTAQQFLQEDKFATTMHSDMER